MALARKMREEHERLSTQVCDEVAADAAAEMRALHPARDASAVERNTRRRVYDALKVMVALGCIAKVGKSLRWVGESALRSKAIATPAVRNSETKAAAAAVDDARAVVGAKRKRARELAASLAAFDALKRRRTAEPGRDDMPLVRFPFVVVAGAKEVDATTNNDRSSAALRFTEPFVLYTETDIVGMLAPRSRARGPRVRRLTAEQQTRRPRGRPKTAAVPNTPTPASTPALSMSPTTVERGVNVLKEKTTTTGAMKEKPVVVLANKPTVMVENSGGGADIVGGGKERGPGREVCLAA